MRAKPRFLEFFAGAGLVRQALEPQWRCAFANDVSAKKAEIYRANFGGRELTVADVASLDAATLPDADMAWASFPCQDLSLAGWRRGLSAPRSGTFWPFWRLMRDLRRQGRRPPLIVIENVVGLLHGSDFSGLCEALAQLDLRFGAMLIDARWFVPQSRPRVFVVAAQQQGRCGDQSPKGSWFPPAVRRAHSRLTTNLQRRWIWWSLPQPVAVPASINRLIEADPPDARWLASDEVGRLCGMMTAANQVKLRQALSRSEPTVGFLYRRTRDGCQRPELRFDGLAGCLRTPGGGSSRQTVVDVQRGQVRMRLLTGREAARLMGAPDAFALPDNYNDAYRAMGDGVAVPAVEWLSENLLRPLSATQP